MVALSSRMLTPARVRRTPAAGPTSLEAKTAAWMRSSGVALRLSEPTTRKKILADRLTRQP